MRKLWIFSERSRQTGHKSSTFSPALAYVMQTECELDERGPKWSCSAVKYICSNSDSGPQDAVCRQNRSTKPLLHPFGQPPTNTCSWSWITEREALYQSEGNNGRTDWLTDSLTEEWPAVSSNVSPTVLEICSTLRRKLWYLPKHREFFIPIGSLISEVDTSQETFFVRKQVTTWWWWCEVWNYFGQTESTKNLYL